MRTYLSLALALCLLTALNACKKEDQPSSFEVRLTDAPFDAEEVNVEIKEVLVNYQKDHEGWIPLNTKAGVYNLLTLQNGVETVLATGSLSGGIIKEVRFVLGQANSIKIGGKTYPLIIPGGAEAGLKIKVGKHLKATLEQLTVDFDAGLSIVKTGNDAYKLKPVIRIK